MQRRVTSREVYLGRESIDSTNRHVELQPETLLEDELAALQMGSEFAIIVCEATAWLMLVITRPDGPWTEEIVGYRTIRIITTDPHYDFSTWPHIMPVIMRPRRGSWRPGDIIPPKALGV